MARKAREIGDVLEAAYRLAGARLIIALFPPRSFLCSSAVRLRESDAVESADRIRTALCRAAARVPWKSDCLVQAVAAERWFASLGIKSRIHLGVCKDDRFDAHAWLSVDGKTVLGASPEHDRTFEPAVSRNSSRQS